LAELSHLTIATVSEHLKVLRKSQLLTLDKQGRFWLYRTDPEVLRWVVAQLSGIAEAADGP
jgi:DNA-binding transcriptional ArsR family regulator